MSDLQKILDEHTDLYAQGDNNDDYLLDREFLTEPNDQRLADFLAKSMVIKEKIAELSKRREVEDQASDQEELTNENLGSGKQSEFTIARQTLAIYYLVSSQRVDFSLLNKMDVGKFVQFLTGKELDNDKFENTNTYKKVKTIFIKEPKNQVNDLRYILPFFESLHLDGCVKMIKKDIEWCSN